MTSGEDQLSDATADSVQSFRAALANRGTMAGIDRLEGERFGSEIDLNRPIRDWSGEKYPSH